MAHLKVCIRFRPRLYTEILTNLFGSFKEVEIVELPPSDLSSPETGYGKAIDVFVLPINNQGRPEIELLPGPVSESKIVAVSPGGEFGLRRLPYHKHWEPVEPFGLDQLIREVVCQPVKY
jgi:hypothetical protein